ncbi:MAG: hypothetical protein ABSG94_00735 [Brevinematales bacterium]|jgi:hypothetical protein
MKRTGSFIGLFLILAVFVLIFSFIYYYRIDKMLSLNLIFPVSKSFLFYLPVIASLSVLWPIVFRSPGETPEGSGRGGRGGSNFNITVFMFLVLALAFALQEYLLPELYDSAGPGALLQKNAVKDSTGEKFTLNEFNSLGGLKMNSNIVFSAGSSYIYFAKMYESGSSYYVEGFRFINYKTSGDVDYIISAGYAKIVDDLIYIVSPAYFEYSGRAVKNARQIRGNKAIVLPYRAKGIFALSSDSPESMSLIKVILYNDYAFSSGINFHSLGNVIFNRIGYYIILVLMLLISSTFGTAFKNMRILRMEYLQTAVFYIVSLALLSVFYDTFTGALNMIYFLFI